MAETPGNVFNPARLASLRATGLLDSPAEASFDRVARLTAKLLGAPIATVTLVDDNRQFFKSCVGLPEPLSTVRQTPLSHSFCQYVVGSESLLVVPDARLHPLLHDNPAIADSNVIAYLGAPLKTASGHTLGSLCAIDNQPREWTASQIEVITDLAAFISTELEARTAREAVKNAELLKQTNDELELRVRQRTRQLDREKRFVEAVLQNVSDGIVACDRDGVITFTNAALYGMLGVEEPPGGLTNQWAAEHLTVYDPDTLAVVPAEDRPLRRAARGEAVQPVEYLVKHRTAGSRFLVVSARTMRAETGEILGAVCGCHDITQLRHSQEQLVQARKAADSANLAKSDFLANMSHEIRTPITAIIGFSELQQSQGVTAAQSREFNLTVQRNAEHLLDLVNDILDLSKIEAGEMRVESIDCDVATLLEETAGMMRRRARERNLELTLSIDASIPRRLRTDPLRLRQIAMNLISNSIKFTREGSVNVGARYEKGKLLLTVRDSGIGMTPEQIERLFRPFSQADETMSRRFGGSGLGLTICKRLAGMLGGDIAVESTPGVGSVFTLTIDAPQNAACPAEPERTAGDVPAVLRGRVLVAEDGRDNQRLIHAILNAAGLDVTIVENGLLALEQLGQRPFDLVLMDVQMPLMDGYTAVAELRKNGHTLPVVALTAHATTEVRTHCKAQGITDFLSKPFRRAALLEMVARHLPPTGRTDRKASDAAREASQDFAPCVQHKPLVTPTVILQSTIRDMPQLAAALAAYVDGLPGEVLVLQTLLARQDLGPLARVLHQIKGAGGGYGFDAISDVAAEAEDAISAEASAAEIATKVNVLINTLRNVEGFGQSRSTVASA